MRATIVDLPTIAFELDLSFVTTGKRWAGLSEFNDSVARKGKHTCALDPRGAATIAQNYSEAQSLICPTGRRDHIRSVVTIALNTGMRRAEILGLQWEHVNFLARTIFIAKSKTGRTRTIPMNDIVLKELMALKQDAGPKEVVFSNSRTGVDIDSIKTGWRSACRDAGLVNLRFHDTRHTFATRLRANGVHEWDI